MPPPTSVSSSFSRPGATNMSRLCHRSLSQCPDHVLHGATSTRMYDAAARARFRLSSWRSDTAVVAGSHPATSSCAACKRRALPVALSAFISTVSKGVTTCWKNGVVKVSSSLPVASHERTRTHSGPTFSETFVISTRTSTSSAPKTANTLVVSSGTALSACTSADPTSFTSSLGSSFAAASADEIANTWTVATGMPSTSDTRHNAPPVRWGRYAT
mmetsp:Transcript_13367/g.56128  ORF Transcript_13367/g.56128 Transcript_13367/m.56128 type:complete len:216 (-) Transcript_13367:603-1250(-)